MSEFSGSPKNASKGPRCCYIDHDHPFAMGDCRLPARWTIHWEPPDRGATTDDYTESCDLHVGLLLMEGATNHVYPLEAAP